MTAVRHPGAAVDTDHRALRFLTAGSVDDGKSTLIGRLLFDSRAILADQLDTLEKRAAGAADRPVAADRRPGGRARTGHHDRRGLPLLRDHAAQVHHRRRAGPRAVHAQHGHRRRRQRCRRGAGRHHQARLATPPGAAAAADAPPRAAGAAAARAEHRVRGQQARRGRPTRRRLRGGARRRCGASPHEAGIEVGRHRAGVGAARRQRHRSRCDARLVRRPDAAAAARAPAGAQERTDGACCCRCSTWRATTAKAPATSRARCGAASPTAACRPATRCSCFPSGETRRGGRGAPRRRARRAAPSAGQSAGLVLDRQLDVSRGDWIATPGTLQRDAALRAPRSPGSTPSRRMSAASTGCATATAGCRRASPRIEHRLDIHTLERHRRARAGRQRDRPGAWSRLQQPLPVEAYADNRVGGALIVVDPASHRTSGALLVRAPTPDASTAPWASVVFIGAGPGAADLITRARRAARWRRPTSCCSTRSPTRRCATSRRRRAGSTSASAASATRTGQADDQRAAGAGTRATARRRRAPEGRRPQHLRPPRRRTRRRWPRPASTARWCPASPPRSPPRPPRNAR